jgi:hypothetical protein
VTVEIDSWLTAVRLRRLPEVLAAIRTHPPPGVPEQHVNRVAWKRCDGPLNDVEGLIDVLLGAGLLERRGSLTRLTTRGRRVAIQDHQHGGRLLARSLIDAGYFRNQARRLLASGEFSGGGDLVCKRSSVVGVAAQLTGALRRWREVILDSHLRVPAALVEELLAAWALQPISRAPNEDDDSLGYDIRNAGTSPERCIEVKGSQGREVRFFLSSNEWEVGHRLGDAYEVHFWGGISLTRPRPEEYRALRGAGYPLVFGNLAKTIESGELLATPSQYLVTIGGSDASSAVSIRLEDDKMLERLEIPPDATNGGCE